MGPESAALLMEDSAHCLGYIAKKEGIPVADISVHSFGSEKFLSTNFGGAIWLNPKMLDQNLRNNIAQALADLPATSAKVSARVWLYPRLNGVLNRLPKSISQRCRTILIKTKLFRSPIMPAEQRAVNYEPAQRLRNSQIKRILTALKTYDKNVEHRAKLTQIYGEYMGDNKWDGLALVRYPVLAKTPEQAEYKFKTMRQKGMFVGKWYRPLFFPGVKDSSLYNYRAGQCPVAEDISAKIINFPTSLNTTPEQAREIANEFIS
jgi:dTDP-4-amino-4,6-dideoxygalactose transaminase